MAVIVARAPIATVATVRGLVMTVVRVPRVAPVTATVPASVIGTAATVRASAAMTVVRFEPLRETAQRALIEAHLAEHNRVEARRAFDRYRRLLHDEMGIAPSAELSALVTLR